MSPAVSSSSRTIPCAAKADIPGKFWPGRPLPPAPAKATAVPEATVNDTSSMAVTRLSARPRTPCRPQRMHKRMADVATCEPVFGHSDTPGSEPHDRQPITERAADREASPTRAPDPPRSGACPGRQE
jgi:hypothetical protein